MSLQSIIYTIDKLLAEQLARFLHGSQSAIDPGVDSGHKSCCSQVVRSLQHESYFVA